MNQLSEATQQAAQNLPSFERYVLTGVFSKRTLYTWAYRLVRKTANHIELTSTEDRLIGLLHQVYLTDAKIISMYDHAAYSWQHCNEPSNNEVRNFIHRQNKFAVK